MNGKNLNGILIEEQNVDTRKDRILRLCIDLCICKGGFYSEGWMNLSFPQTDKPHYFPELGI